MVGRKRIIVDLDGVCYEWERTARYMLRAYRDAPNLLQESTAWDSIKEWVTPEDWKWLWSDGVSLGLFRHGHVVTGALIGLQRLTGDGHEIHFATARPKSAVRDTVGWINYHMQDVLYSGLTILSKGESKATLDGDILIDDRPENILDWIETGRQAVLFDRPWNQVPNGWLWSDNGIFVTRAKGGWSDIPETIGRINDDKQV